MTTATMGCEIQFCLAHVLEFQEQFQLDDTCQPVCDREKCECCTICDIAGCEKKASKHLTRYVDVQLIKYPGRDAGQIRLDSRL